MKTFLIKIAMMVLKKAAVKASLRGDDLRIFIALGDIVIMDKVLDLMKDGIDESE